MGDGNQGKASSIFLGLGLILSMCLPTLARAMDWRCVGALGRVKFIGKRKFLDQPNTSEAGLILWVDNGHSPSRDTVLQYETRNGKTTVWRLVPNKPNHPTRYNRGDVHWEGDAFSFVPSRVIYTKNGDYDALFDPAPKNPTPVSPRRKPHGIETVREFMDSPLGRRFVLTESSGTYYLRDLGFADRRGMPHSSVASAVAEAERRFSATILGAEAVYPD